MRHPCVLNEPLSVYSSSRVFRNLKIVPLSRLQPIPATS